MMSKCWMSRCRWSVSCPLLALSADVILKRSCVGEPGRVVSDLPLLCVWTSTSATVMLVVTSDLSELALSFLLTSSAPDDDGGGGGGGF